MTVAAISPELAEPAATAMAAMAATAQTEEVAALVGTQATAVREVNTTPQQAVREVVVGLTHQQAVVGLVFSAKGQAVWAGAAAARELLQQVEQRGANMVAVVAVSWQGDGDGQ